MLKILSISGILPIPGLITSNDFVLETYKTYSGLFPEDRVTLVRPTQYKTNIKKIITGTTEFDKLNKKTEWNIGGFRVFILPFFSARRFRNVQGLVTHSIYLLNRKKIEAILSAAEPDVIHAQYIFPDGLLAYRLHKKYGIPYVITTHNELFYFRHLVSERFAMKVLRSASAILPINFRSYSFFTGRGLSTTMLLPLGFHKSFLRLQKEPSVGPVKIVTIAELIPLKNIDKVIRAVAALGDEVQFTYTIIGRGPEKQRLNALVADKGMQDRIQFKEHVPHDRIADELYNYDIFIMPSYVETFGRVYFEAMAMGIPVICARNSGIHGYFKEGVEGFSVDHRNIEEISSLLKRLIANPVERLKVGQQGRKMVENYTWERIAGVLRERYQEAVTNSKFNQSGSS
jgi:glycosyltransferase involved in cell wall biosynthesis